MANIDTRTLRVAVYCRISEDREGVEAGVTRQEEDCQELLVRNPGWTLVAPPVVDNDTSATKDRPRPGFESVMRMVESGQADAVICYKTGRFLRSRKDRLRVNNLFTAKSARLIPTQGAEFRYDTADGRMLAGIVGEVDQAETERMAERVERAARQRAEEGRPNGGTRRFGFTAHGMEIKPEEADVIRECARRLLAGENLSAITRWLNDQGIKPPKAERWQRTSLRNVLTASHVAGKRLHKGVEVGVANHGAILDDDTWQAVRVKLAPNRAPHSNQVKYLLAGIARCGTCGAKMWSQSTKIRGKRYLYYACVPKVEGGCQKVFRSIEKTDDHVESVIKARLKDRRFRQKLISADAPDAGELIKLEREIKQTEDALINIAEELADRTDEIGKKQFRAANTKLLAKLEDLQRRRAEATEASVFGDLVAVIDIDAYWAGLVLGRKRELIKALADITIFAANKKPQFDKTLIDVDFERKRSRGLLQPETDQTQGALTGGIEKSREDFAEWLADYE
ncbi:recombinase family protein [Pseudofrankia sp. BMG5.37]|uniref:recombinase family protein n=1 Tax=Pseudofrankia sp. BMG5.37 TaxID=3050035 RepID=UPI002895912B|nr:recombinase family protein [Pseudofrankia sp. BMG5.37]MDT3441774.1 recombinase family protein [Pseudofrankia sp. BMG5.37]